MKRRISAVTLVFLIMFSAIFPVKAATNEGYGEDETSLGQFVDSFETSGNVSVTVDVIRNATLEAMELNGSAGVGWDFDAYYLQEYFETFPVGWTVVIDNAGTLTKDNTHVFNGSWSVKVYTPDGIDLAYGYRSIPEMAGDYNLSFRIFPDAADEPDFCYVLLLQDVSAGFNLIVTIDFAGGITYLQNQDSDSVDNVGALIVGQWNHVFIFWDDTANKFSYWINAVNKGQFDPYGDTNPDRLWIGDTSDAVQSSIHWIDDVIAGTTSEVEGGYEPEGYFTTVDYLSDPLANGSALTALTNTSIPANTQILLEFSEDNITWVLNDWQPLFGGFEAVDLRDLNYSAGYHCRFNLSTTDSSVTPRVYQNRLITTIGNVSTVYQNLTGEWIYYNLTAINVSTGIHDNGFLNSTYFIDGDTWNCSEVVGVPGYVVDFNVTGIDTRAISLWFVSYVYYDGSASHEINVEIWNFTSNAWVEIGEIPDMLGFEWMNYSIYGLRIPNNFVNSTGALVGRLYHADAGNINHDIYFDRINVLAFVPLESVAPADEEFQFFWIVLAIALMLIGILISKMWFEEGDP